MLALLVVTVFGTRIAEEFEAARLDSLGNKARFVAGERTYPILGENEAGRVKPISKSICCNKGPCGRELNRERNS